MLLAGAVGAISMVTISGLTSRSMVSEQASVVMAAVQDVSTAREAYLLDREPHRADTARLEIQELRAALETLRSLLAERGEAESGVAGAIVATAEFETAFEMVVRRFADQQETIEQVIAAGDQLGQLTQLISSEVGKAQTSAVAQAEVAGRTQEAIRLVDLKASTIEAEALNLAPRFGRDGKYKQKELTDEVMKEISHSLATIGAAGTTLAQMKALHLDQDIVKSLSQAAEALQTALPDLLVETNLFNKMGMKKTVADLLGSLEREAVGLRFANYAVLGDGLAAATQTQNRLASLAAVSQKAIALATAVSHISSGAVEMLADPGTNQAGAIAREIGTLQDLANSLKAAGAVLPAAAASIDAMPDAIAQYDAAFSAIMATRSELSRLQVRLQGLATDVSVQIGAIAADHADKSRSAGQAAFLTIGVALALAIVVGLALAIALNLAIVRPIRMMTDVMARLARGDLGVNIPEVARRDEIGEMTRMVQVFKDSAIERDRLRAAQDEEDELARARQQRVERLIDGFRATVGELLAAVGGTSAGLDATAQDLTRIAQASAERAQATAEASGQASRNVGTVASAAEELATSISEISGQIARTTDVVGRASQSSRETNRKVESLAEAAARIGEVVTLIKAIAEQTNLLALNATIEAARAGDAGRGFAVVAAEVKELATQTSRATEDIAGQIAAIQAATSDSVEAIASFALTMNEVDTYTGAIASAVTQQGAATSEISDNVQRAAEGTGVVAANVRDLSSAVEATSCSSDQVVRASEELNSKTEALQDVIDRFLREVAAA
ncbi:methyl-accepting chemotaxis protein [Roseibium sp.]|uniref:methyl-accepting chemotaxis protein n=1 Tax=Roseibium sp. TaxID=1936156 RepID=UPI003A971448